MKVQAIYDRDTQRFHKYVLRTETIQGSLYFAKTIKQIPKTLEVEMTVKADNEK